ncbi:hypothetical protein [Nostoc sp.]|uniref:hypothetical protein n=1 Tax=Nostoc sp. TaxID=1180 RepID=UPI002FFB2495
MTIQTGYAIASIAALKALTSSQRADSYARIVKSVAWYIFDASSAATADDDLVLLPNDNPSTGRWIKIGGSGGGGSDNINFTAGSIICTSSCSSGAGKAFHFDSPQSGFIEVAVDSAIAPYIYVGNRSIQVSLWTQEPNTDMTGRQFIAELPNTGGSVFIATDDYRPWLTVQAKTGNTNPQDGVCSTFSGNTVTLIAF